MPDGLKLPPQHMPGLHRYIRRFALQRLSAGQVSEADGALPVLGSFGGLRGDLAPLSDFLLPPLVRNFRQPVPEAVRLQSPYFRR